MPALRVRGSRRRWKLLNVHNTRSVCIRARADAHRLRIGRTRCRRGRCRRPATGTIPPQFGAGADCRCERRRTTVIGETKRGRRRCWSGRKRMRSSPSLTPRRVRRRRKPRRCRARSRTSSVRNDGVGPPSSSKNGESQCLIHTRSYPRSPSPSPSSRPGAQHNPRASNWLPPASPTRTRVRVLPGRRCRTKSTKPRLRLLGLNVRTSEMHEATRRKTSPISPNVNRCSRNRRPRNASRYARSKRRRPKVCGAARTARCCSAAGEHTLVRTRIDEPRTRPGASGASQSRGCIAEFEQDRVDPIGEQPHRDHALGLGALRDEPSDAPPHRRKSPEECGASVAGAGGRHCKVRASSKEPEVVLDGLRLSWGAVHSTARWFAG